MAANDGQERTEQPTPKRLQDARQKGQVARSRELGTLAGLLVSAAVFLSLGGYLIQGLTDMLYSFLSLRREEIFDGPALHERFLGGVADTVLLLSPLFLSVMAVGILSAIALGGWSFSPQSLAFKPDKLNPVKGLARVFSWRGIVEMFKSLAKFLLVGLAAITLLNIQGHEFVALGREGLIPALAHMGDLLTWAFLLLSLVLVVVVAIDVPFQLWDHNRQLKMTRQEVKEEFKQTDGSPEVKGRQRRLQMEMAQRRMMEEVPKADVVITNPTHYAVALRYDQESMNAPILIAKGADLMAARIRGIAAEHEVPVLSAPPLARALYHSTELNSPIPVGLYRAVAQVLAYVYHLRQGPIYNREGVSPPVDLPIPDELRRDE